MFVSITRLRIRSIRFMPGFAFHAIRSQRQVGRASGFLAGALLPDRNWTFWTMTGWDNIESMRAYMMAGPHRAAMPKLAKWCAEASVVHWEQKGGDLPSWIEADARMRKDGRPTKISHPGPHHQALDFAPPRVTAGQTINPMR